MSAPTKKDQKTPKAKRPFKAAAFKTPIAIKLVALTVTIVVLVTGFIAHQSGKLFEKEVRETHEQSSDRQTEVRASEVETVMQNFIEKARIVGTILHKQYSVPAEKQAALDLTFRNDKDLVALTIYEIDGDKIEKTESVVNSDYLKGYSRDESYIPQVRAAKAFPLKAVFGGEMKIQNSSVEQGVPLFTVGMPFVKDEYENISHILVADLRLDRLQNIFSTEQAAEFFLLDELGTILAHPKDTLSLKAALAPRNPLIDKALKSKTRITQMKSFVDPSDNKGKYGITYRSPLGFVVVGQIPEEIIREPALMVQRNAIKIGGFVLSAALFFIFLFSITLTAPIETLLGLTREIAKGNFDVHARMQIRSHDEVGDLASAFDTMTEGLKEREKAMNVLAKTQGSDVASALMKQDLTQMGGERKQIAVLFSDLRGFTQFSEGHSPEEVVHMLNEYFEVMVSVIERNKGTVNKFIGDAIMAMWGAPSSTGQDEVLAVKAALEMRIELFKLNELRISRGQPPIKIGVGVHVGQAIAGTIGSTSRMEYTVIGDTVNQASRIEASTKAFGVDILLSHETATAVGEVFLLDLAGEAEVKGKAEPLKLYKVRGVMDNGQEVLIQTPYSDFEAESVDKVKVA